MYVRCKMLSLTKTHEVLYPTHFLGSYEKQFIVQGFLDIFSSRPVKTDNEAPNNNEGQAVRTH